MVWGKGPTLFFYMWIFSSPNIIETNVIENTVISPLNGLGTVSKKSFNHTYKSYFSLFYSTSLYATVRILMFSLVLSFEISPSLQ